MQNDKCGAVFLEGKLTQDCPQDLLVRVRGNAFKPACVYTEKGLLCTVVICLHIGSCNNVQAVIAYIADDTDKLS